MKSVAALSESFFVHSDENDYVVVDVPAFSRNHAAIDVMTSIYDEGNNDSSIDDDDIDGNENDDASYDYCDEFRIQIQRPQEPNSDTTQNEDATVPLLVPLTTPYEDELSLVIADDDDDVDIGSVGPPSIDRKSVV